MKNFFNEFKKFISKGNVLDMAIGIIIGSAFTAIVNSLVQGIIMPALGLLTDGINFSDLKIVLKAATEAKPELAILYGSFLQNTLTFLIVAFTVFCLVKAINKFRSKPDEPQAVPAPSAEIILLSEIRDLLRK